MQIEDVLSELVDKAIEAKPYCDNDEWSWNTVKEGLIKEAVLKINNANS